MTTTPSPSGKLLITKDGPVTTVTLNRPEVHNALDKELSKELNLAMKEIDTDRECRVVILTGAGETFCAGDDIKGFATFEPEDVLWEIRMYQQTANLIDNLVPVTIAAVDGVCTGGGLELTLVCDFVVASRPCPRVSSPDSSSASRSSRRRVVRGETRIEPATRSSVTNR